MAYDAGGDASSDGIGRYIIAYHSPSGDERSPSHCYPVQDDGPNSYPHIILDDDVPPAGKRLLRDGDRSRCIAILIRIERTSGGNLYIVTDADVAESSSEIAARLKMCIAPDGDGSFGNDFQNRISLDGGLSTDPDTATVTVAIDRHPVINEDQVSHLKFGAMDLGIR